MRTRRLARTIGWASLPMGLTLLAPGRVARLFGLGQANKVGRLTVAWPSGEPAQQHWDGLAIDRYHRLVQGEAAQPSRRGSGKP